MSSSAALLALVALALPAVIQADPAVLVYTRTVGFRHDSIPSAIEAFKQQGPTYGINFTFSEDPALFSDQGLQPFDALAFVSNSDEVLNQAGKDAFLSWLEKGGNFLGVHAGCACLFTTDFFRKQVGALFDYHPTLQQATFVPLNTTHPAMTNVPERWTFEEEVYYFRSDPRDVGATVLMTVEDSSFQNTGGVSTGTYTQGSPHPIAWYQDPTSAVTPSSSTSAGRSFFTSLGHKNETWEDPIFLEHVMKGLVWALDARTTKAFDPSAQIGTASKSNASSSSMALSSSSTGGPAGSSPATSRAAAASASSTPPASTGEARERTAGLGLTGIAAGLALVFVGARLHV